MNPVVVGASNSIYGNGCQFILRTLSLFSLTGWQNSMLKIFQQWLDRYFSNEEALLLLLLLAAALLAILTMGQVLAPMMAAMVIAFLMQGMVTRLRQWGMGHNLAVTIAFVVLLVSLGALLLFIMPIMWNQLVRFFNELPRMVIEGQELLMGLPERYPQFLSERQLEQLFASMTAEISGMGQRVLSFSVTNIPMLIGLMIYLILVPILVFFFLKDSSLIMAWCARFLPHHRPVMAKVWQEMNQQFANYVRGKVIEIVIVGAVSYVAFICLGLNYAALLAIAVGLSVVIPFIGAAVVTLPVALVAYFQWGWSAPFIYLMLAYTIIQVLDGNVLVPLLFSEAVNLHPVAIILAVLVFGGLWGFWGVFFAIPLATLVKAILYAWPIAVQEASLVQEREKTCEAAE
ncbi:membrane protein, PerM family [Cellvibrio japonicus Ueda107]|uniref:Membrane protein, PerM family n=2 Tax=Cellvibrio japonicus TaxID=155077 RepID=B3PB28_CELJU|nr:membrane protein, PerM family [Cellvibrio japonicus Ueda107]